MEYRRTPIMHIMLIVLTGLMLFFSNPVNGQDAEVSDTLEFPLRGAFYYPWYPQTWSVGGAHVFYRPELGYYSSDSEAVAAQHIEDMDYAKIDVAIYSWWKITSHNQAFRFPLVLDNLLRDGGI